MMPPGWRGLLADGFCLTDEDIWSSRLGLLAACATQTLTGEFDAMVIVDEAARFLLGPLLFEGDDTREDGVVGEISGQAAKVGHCGIAAFLGRSWAQWPSRWPRLC
jgi:hypothetical protein